MNERKYRNIVKLKPAEQKAFIFLYHHGFNIETIIPSNTPHNKNADFLVDGRIWELKSPEKNRRETIERCFKKAAKQSENLIIDLRNIRAVNAKTYQIIKSRFIYSRSIKRLLVITPDNSLLHYEK